MDESVRDLIDKAYAMRRDGDRDGSLSQYRAAAGVVDNPTDRAHCLRHIGDLLRELDRKTEARAALFEAETLYRGPVVDPLSLANTLRLRALIDPSASLWLETRQAYAVAAAETGFDLQAAFDECDRQMARLAD